MRVSELIQKLQELDCPNALVASGNPVDRDAHAVGGIVSTYMLREQVVIIIHEVD